MHGPCSKKDHSCDADFIVQCARCTTKGEKNKRCLGCNRIIIVTLGNEDVEANEKQQENSKRKVSAKW